MGDMVNITDLAGFDPVLKGYRLIQILKELDPENSDLRECYEIRNYNAHSKGCFKAVDFNRLKGIICKNKGVIRKNLERLNSQYRPCKA